MKQFTLAVVALCTGTALAFPAVPEQVASEDSGLTSHEKRSFFSEKQLVSVSGKHRFVPPNFEKGDQRGPCPGLNALANHGYLPHSGVGTITDFIEATNIVFGLGKDIGAAVGVFGAVMEGDGLSWSIGGPPKPGLTALAPNLIGRPLGISFSHNTYEGDASATRPDLYVAGNDYKLHMPYFKQLYDELPAKSFDALIKHRQTRVETSVHTNPYFFSGPFTGIAVSGGANSFIWRLAANHSAEYPDGYLSKEVFKTFWSVKEDKNGKLTWKEGWDRIPENWYRRSLINPYNAAELAKDLGIYFAKYPDTVKVGGNLGKVDSFVGVDLTNLTGGVFNAEDFAKGNTAACFAFQAATQLAPDMLSKVWKDISGPLSMIESVMGKVVADLSCPKLKKFNTAALNRYPGYSQLKSDGTY